MYPFFDLVVEPLLTAAEAKRVVEIGALRGETTERMLDKLGPASEIHVIDPVPAFDPSEHQQQFPGRYLFYRDLSHAVLPTLPPMDAALIDGDHNWYTVYHELRLLHEVARDAGEPMPVMVLHDVCWPYGRRDLYYGPDGIPEEFRHPYGQQGLMPGVPEALKRGGLNPTMENALMEGGPRNGVMTAVDDFVAEHDKPLRVVVLPVYFGLAIVVEEERLERQPALAALLDRLEGPEGAHDLLLMAEDVRLHGLVVQHGVFYNAERRLGAAASRYLDLLKGALLNEHYLEHELRIDHLVRAIDDDFRPSADKLRDPMRDMKEQAQRLQALRRAGQLHDKKGVVAGYLPYADMGRVRLDHLQTCLTTVKNEAVAGDFVDVGVGRGGSSIFLRGFAEANEMLEPTVWVADEFRATPAGVTPDKDGPVGGGAGFPHIGADIHNVRGAFQRFDLLDRKVKFLEGDPAPMLTDAAIGKVALLRIGGGLGADTADVLEAIYDKVTLGGFIVFDRYREPACRDAVDAFLDKHGIADPLEQIDFAGAFLRKTEHRDTALSPAPLSDEQQRHAAGAPLAPPAPRNKVSLSVIVVFHNMRREAERTLYSLTRAYQQGIDDLDYEVIAIDNGSAPGQKLDKKRVRSFGPEFRYIDMGDMGEEVSASPVPALNLGIAKSRGENIALMIDGAHVLTPGVLRYGMLGLRSYEPAIVATQQWYVGPGQQGEAMTSGYDQAFEDNLFDAIEWPSDGYQLFNIGHFIGDRDWLDGLWESNCLFAPRALLEQVGGFDERFSMPGGGFANLELYERLGASPDTTFVTMLGEGSFHQVHGGTTTNVASVDERHRRLADYVQHYGDLRGRGYRGHGKRIHYVGTMHADAARTRARRLTAPNFFKRGATEGADGVPTTPVPVPQELTTEFIDAFWRSLRWREATWLGRKVQKTPTDLFAYQEIISDTRPDWIIETGTGGGGRALFLATICEALGHGQVVTVDRKPGVNAPEHPRLHYVVGQPHEDATIADVRALVGDRPHAMVILGSRGSASRTIREFRAYSPFVSVGSYAVVEDTIVNGHPVWPDFGNGPAEAVRSVVEERGDFAADTSMEKYLLTFNPGGFLKRLS